MTVAVVTLSLTYSFLWGPIVRHTSTWIVPGDIWSTYRAAHWIGWGDLGGVYGGDSQLVTFPGIAVLLAPVALLTNAFGMSESIAPLLLAHPTSWCLLGPSIVLLGCTVLFALDALAEELGADAVRRTALCWIEALVVFQVVTIWGHPEDLVALAAAGYGLLAIFQDRWSMAGCLWGAAIVVQPLVLLAFPLAFIQIPRRERLRVCCFATAPSVVLVGTPLLAQWGTTSQVFFHQANFPKLDHPTPWIGLAPHLSRASVGAGPGRLLAIVGAVTLAIVALRRPPTRVGLLWLIALALSLRCAFEAVMVPFYLGPPLALILVVTSLRNSWARLVGASTVSVVASVMAFHRLSEWAYWMVIVLPLAVGLGFAWPGACAFGGSRSEIAEPATVRMSSVEFDS